MRTVLMAAFLALLPLTLDQEIKECEKELEKQSLLYVKFLIESVRCEQEVKAAEKEGDKDRIEVARAALAAKNGELEKAREDRKKAAEKLERLRKEYENWKANEPV
jgi:hypothetical protein